MDSNENQVSPANMGKSWADDEIRQLLQNVKKNRTYQEIATEHQRTVGGITSRLMVLAADYHSEGRTIEVIQKFTGLTKELVEEGIRRRKMREIMDEKRKERRAVAKEDTATKSHIQRKITSFTEAEPTMKEVMAMLKDIQMKLDFLLLRPSQPE